MEFVAGVIVGLRRHGHADLRKPTAFYATPELTASPQGSRPRGKSLGSVPCFDTTEVKQAMTQEF